MPRFFDEKHTANRARRVQRKNQPSSGPESI
jgi:hypothetical protein